MMDTNEFLLKYNIDSTYKDFFRVDRIEKIEGFLNLLENTKTSFVPKREHIFKALNSNLNKIKVCILGMDPYKQIDVATGLAFEVELSNWENKKINTSLKNILKLIYFSYYGERKDICDIREEIRQEKIQVLEPNKIFKYWSEQGVLLLNTALTTEMNISGKHLGFWKEITGDLIEYISKRNEKIKYFLWGKKAQEYEKYIYNGEIFKSKHPAICGKLKDKEDFMRSECFIETKKIINWLY